MFALKDGEGDAAVEVVACGRGRVGLFRSEHGITENIDKTYLPEMLCEEDSEVLVWAGGGGSH